MWMVGILNESSHSQISILVKVVVIDGFNQNMSTFFPVLFVCGTVSYFLSLN